MTAQTARAPSLIGSVALEAFLRALPKAELHLHLEGTLDRARAHARAGRAHADGIRHIEVFFDPQSHLVRRVRFDDVVTGIRRALEEVGSSLGITSRLILCFLRDESPESAQRVLEMALPFRDAIAGVGLDSAEIGHPPRQFAEVFARARDAGFACVAHAGEEGPAGYVAEALDVLRVQRIDHGVRAADDPDLIERLRRERVALTMCPLSNLRLGVVADLAEHPLKRLLDAGMHVTVNSDDPAYFGGYLVDNFLAVERALARTKHDITTLARNSITASLLPESEQRRLRAQIDALVGAQIDGQREPLLREAAAASPAASARPHGPVAPEEPA